METQQFKTTIKCSGCVAQVTPALNKLLGEHNWNVDIQNPDKILTVDPVSPVAASEIIEAVSNTGFKAEKIEP